MLFIKNIIHSIKHTSYLWLITFVAIIIFIIIRDVMQIALPPFLLSIIVIFPSLFLSESFIVRILFFLLPLACGIPSGYIFPSLLIILLIKSKNSSLINIILFCAIIVMEILHYPLYDFIVNWTDVIKYLSSIMIFIYFSNPKTSKSLTQDALTYFLLGATFLFIVLLYISINNGWTNDVAMRLGTMGGDSYYEDNMSLSTNPNYIASFSIITIAASLTLFIQRKISLLYFLFILLPAVIAGVYCLSRTWIIILVLLLFTYGLILINNKKNGITFLLIIVFALGTYYIGSLEIIESLQNRFEYDNMSTGGGRTEIFGLYNDYLLNHLDLLFWGTGAVYYGKVISSIPASIHNGFQQIWVSYGLLGFILFLWYGKWLIKKNYDNGGLVSILPLLLSLIFIQTSQFLKPEFNMYPILISIVLLRINQFNEFTNERCRYIQKN